MERYCEIAVRPDGSVSAFFHPDRAGAPVEAVAELRLAYAHSQQQTAQEELAKAA